MAARVGKGFRGKSTRSSGSGTLAALRAILWDDPRWRWGSIGGACVLLLLVVVIRGCGGSGADTAKGRVRSAEESDDENSPAMKAQQEKVRKFKEEQEAKKQKDRLAELKRRGEERQRAQQQAARGALAATTAANRAAAPRVADDPARWSDDDFLIARKLGHPRLCEGLRARAARRADDPGFVEFLVAVLTAPGGAKARSQELASTVAGLLAEHGTPASRKALARLLSGRLTTDDDRAAVSAVLSALAKHPTAEHEAMLLHVLTKAPQVRPDPSGQVTAAALQQQAYALLQQQGSPRLRLQLAQWMADPATPKAVADKFGPVIKEPKRANLEAQALLWERDGLDAAARLAVEQRLAAYSAEAAGWISGRRRAAADDEPDWLARVARTLWREEFGAAVRERLRAAHSLKEARGAFWLAASLPTAAARADLQRVLRRQWEAGPAALGADGSSPQPPPDPGFLLALKRAAQDIRDDARRSGARVSMPAPALGREEMKKRIERQAELARAWLESRDAWLRAVCRDLESAGRAQSAAARRGGQTPPGQRALEACGLAPYPDTTVDAAYYLDWREAVRAGLSSAEGDPLVVAYVRSEARGRLLKVAMHYQRQLKGFRQWAVPGGLWLDALEGNEADGVFCSVDVLVTEAHPGSGKLPNEEQDLWVEVLTVRGSSLRGPGDYAATPGP